MDITELLKSHVDNVDAALKGFEGKLADQHHTIRALEAKAARTALFSGGMALSQDGEVKDLNGFRGGNTASSSLIFPADERKILTGMMEGKAMTGAVEADGGFLIPEIIANTIETMILKQSPIRSIANVIPMDNRLVRLPVNRKGDGGGWIGEGSTRAETGTPTLAQVTPTGGTIYALPKVTEEFVDDAVNNVEAFITENVVDTLAELESQAFISGDGTNKPTGFLNGTPVATADASRAFGTLQYVASGTAGSLGTALIDKLMTMVFSLKAGYRQAQGCAWVMSTEVLQAIALLRDSTGAPIYLPSLRENVPGVLLGYPVVECEHMPAVGANAFPVAFGNWKRGYVIGDRTPLTFLRDPYSVKGQILWYFRKRVYGAVWNSEAIKLLKCSAS